MLHHVWQKVRKPFRYPTCTKSCKWEVYDATSAGCLLCGSNHTCMQFAFEGNCPLEECDDGTRVCTITGYVIPETRHSKYEFLDHVVMNKEPVYHSISQELDMEICKYVDKILDSTLSRACMKEENNMQSKKLHKCLVKVIRVFKMKHPNVIPNMCQLMTSMIHHEKRLKFIYQASNELKRKCCVSILLCVLDLKQKGFKVCIGSKLQDLVCGLIYLLRTGISYKHYELLVAIPEIGHCLPVESRLKTYFNINSKVITSIENEVKLAFRDFHQSHPL
jgi:hypothetical protein